MSLSPAERRRTAEELAENVRRAGTPSAELQDDLGLSAAELDAVLRMDAGVDPATVWRVRDHLDAAVRAAGREPAPYSSLTEEMRASARRWFGIG